MNLAFFCKLLKKNMYNNYIHTVARI